tara:strand:+ start:547 stop:798 length:252 start_codon:yes stop_codon:yes gene_type:complete
MNENHTKVMETIAIAQNNSMRSANEAFEVLTSIKEGAITLPEASEMTNALGKVNGATANLIKANLLALTINNQSQQVLKRIEE